MMIYPKLKLGLTISKGNEILEHRPMVDAHSWVRNFYNHYTFLAGAFLKDATTFSDGKMNLKDTSGSVFTETSSTSHCFRIDTAGAGTESWGIVVGTGSTAVTIDDYILQTRTAHGTTSGKISYAAATATTASWVGGIVTETLVRYFNNNSGDTLEITESGIYGYFWNTVAVWKYVMICRDVFAAASIPDAAQLKMVYEVTFDVSP